MKEDYLDDRVIVPDYIKAMSDEELDLEIVRLEQAAAREKSVLLSVQNSQKAV